VAQLKANGSQVSKIFFSIGGAVPWVSDFTTIQHMLQNGMADALRANFAALKQAFTFDGVCAIDGFDIDNEENVEASTIVDFCTMLFELGFEVTFCPFDSAATWQGYMQTLWDNGHHVSWWNLQCYAGGSGNQNDLKPWIDALSAVAGEGQGAGYLVPGFAVLGATDSPTYDWRCPDNLCGVLSDLRSDDLAGAFLWHYDFVVSNTHECSGTIPTIGDYVVAIRNGLAGHCGGSAEAAAR
jgi:hypothetical protein